MSFRNVLEAGAPLGTLALAVFLSGVAAWRARPEFVAPLRALLEELGPKPAYRRAWEITRRRIGDLLDAMPQDGRAADRTALLDHVARRWGAAFG